MEAYLTEIKECLLLFDYPLANCMSDDELADIFHSSNRCFLVSWMLKLLDPAYETIVQNLENGEEILSNLVYEHGFCSKKEKSAFMTGELAAKEQLKILLKMFRFIKKVKKPIQEEDITVSLEAIAALSNTNLNLFPMYGDIKLPKPGKCPVEVEGEICRAETPTGNEDQTLTEVSVNDKESDTNTAEIIIGKLRLMFPKFKDMTENLIKETKTLQNVSYEFNPESANVLRECNEIMSKICQFINDLNTIQEFSENNNPKYTETIGNNEVLDMYRILGKEFFEVMNYR